MIKMCQYCQSDGFKNDPSDLKGLYLHVNAISHNGILCCKKFRSRKEVSNAATFLIYVVFWQIMLSMFSIEKGINKEED